MVQHILVHYFLAPRHHVQHFMLHLAHANAIIFLAVADKVTRSEQASHC